MTAWIAYDQFVDRVRHHHHHGFSGLITGVTKNNHSFQIGFLNGGVVLLNYRILRGGRALDKIAQIEEAKITEHHTPDITNITIPQDDLPSIDTILSRLTTRTGDKIEPAMAEVTTSANSTVDIDLSETGAPVRVAHALPDSAKLANIKSAAIHHFGPIGAIVCDEYLSDSNLSSTDLLELLHRITEDVGANDQDTRAFMQSIS